MCEKSKAARKSSDAKPGQTLALGTGTYGFTAFREPGVRTTSCVICVPNKAILTLFDLSKKIQMQFGIGAVAQVQFQDTGDASDDIVEFENGKLAMLHEIFGRRTRIFVGSIADYRASQIPATATPATTPAFMRRDTVIPDAHVIAATGGGSPNTTRAYG